MNWNNLDVEFDDFIEILFNIIMLSLTEVERLPYFF